MRLLRRLADPRNPSSLGVWLRRRRFELFRELLLSVPRPLTILDVGGTSNFWDRMEFLGVPDVHIVLLNLEAGGSPHSNVVSVAGDARDLSQFKDGEFEVAFSNSVIEHVGGRKDQERMARELRRVSRRYFIQTPNRWFPVEPHFLFPAFQFLPRRVQTWLVQHFALGYTGRIPDRAKAEARVSRIELLSVRDMRALFPEARLYRERVLGLTKSITAYHGWA